MRPILIATFAVFCVLPVQAQSLVDRVADFAKAPKDKGVDGQVRGIVDDAILEAWPELTMVLNAGSPFPRPPVVVAPVLLEREAPRFDGHSLIFPGAYMGVLEDLCTYVTHDVLTAYLKVYTNTWSTPLYKPFAESAIWPLLDEPSREVETPDLRFMAGLLYCPSEIALCKDTRNIARAGLLLFIIGHELNHAARHDVLPADGVYPLVWEKAADANAIKVLDQVAREHGRMSPLQELALYLGPLMALDLEVNAAKNSTDRQLLAERRSAVAAEIPERSRLQAEEMAIAKSESTVLGQVRFELEETPDSLFVDGVRAPTSELGRDLSFTTGVHWVVAWKGSSVACDKVRISEARNDVKLHFDNLLVGGSPAEAELYAMAKSNDWCGVLRDVSASADSPRDANLSAWLSEARRRLLLADHGLPVSLQFHPSPQ